MLGHIPACSKTKEYTMRFYAASLLLLAAATLLGTATAQAKEPVQFQVGKIPVWTIADVTSDRDMGVFQADPETLKQYAPSGKSPSGVMTFVVRAGNEVVLIDTGFGRDSGDTPSMLLPGLKAIGLSPEDITLVLITHMHGDHIGGLLRKGEKTFPKARLLIGKKEYEFWLDEKSRAAFPGSKANFDLAKRVSDMYGKAVGLFAFGDSVAPGITALDSVGHTPGHTSFLIESEGKKLLCVGDLLHAAALQFPRPDINARYDMNPDQARASRERILKQAADEKLPLAGMHFPFPGVGRSVKATEGFTYQPGLE